MGKNESIKIEKASPNNILPMVPGSMNFELTSEDNSLAYGQKIRFYLNTKTNEPIVSTTTELLGSVVPREQISALAQQGYNIMLEILK